MFLRSRWYVAARSREVTRFAPVARTLLDEKVVLFRIKDNSVVALENRCSHRYAPLSAGTVTENGIACPYHGMTYNSSGICVLNPTQPKEKIPPNARVRSYPLVERHGFLWIWMGKSDLADPDLIPGFTYFDDPQWHAETKYLHVAANYLLIVDNLLDLTHINFVHGDIFGSPELVDRTTSKTETTDRGVTERWWIPDSPPAPVWRSMIHEPWMSGNVDYWMDMSWEPAANLIQHAGIMPAGTPRSAAHTVINLNCLTPESMTTTHYFWGQSHKLRADSVAYGGLIIDAATYAFDQDKHLLEKVQQNMGTDWDILAMNPVINKGDRGSLLARRMLRDLLAAERARATASKETPEFSGVG
jgi:phenylpropionate dioxygenase-like ring-hydroxylating dioxygenase large terminal subunit